jgi:ATP adenylyltransferase
MAFIAGKKQAGCIFCTNPGVRDPRESLVLAITKYSVVMLNKYPYANGHLLVAPRRHTAEFHKMRASGRNDLAETLQRSAAILRKVLRPDGMNLGMNLGQVAGAGIADHLHWHIVPRWSGDTNFMPVVGEVRVMPQHLLESWDNLYPHFSTLRDRK